MHHRTRVIAAATAVTAAIAAGSTAAAMASTTGAKPSATAKTASASGKCTTDSELAAQLGVSTTRLDQAVVAVKTSLAKGSGDVTQAQFDAAMAHALGVAQARVHQVFASAGKACGSKTGAKPGSRSGSRSGSSGSDARIQAALIAAVASSLHVSTARVSAALAPMFAAGQADPASPAFAAAARSLGVSAGQLIDALTHAKESLGGGGGGGSGRAAK